jgi:CheY-like chemotaxis protein/HPt (histidine-containing phosphotransfer) domain-containing protein
MDMTMSPANGLTIARKMGDDPALKRNIVMMLPCYSISNNFNRCQEAGIPTHIIKPVKKLELQKTIMSVLGAFDEKKEESSKTAGSASLGLTVLIAEDNPTSQLIARKMLEKIGCTVRIAGNGLEATRMIQQGKYDLVLMDFEMPQMNGLEATRVIRDIEKETNGHLPIIAMTANAMKKDFERCIEAGMDGYLSKPVSPENLIKAIKGLMPSLKTEAKSEMKPEARPAPEPPVDLETALKTVGNDKDILKEVLTVFLKEDSPRLLQNIREAIRQEAGQTIKAEAHGMKGASSALGGKMVAAAAARLEAAGLSGDMSAAQGIFAEMCTEIERFKDFYSRIDLETVEASDEE